MLIGGYYEHKYSFMDVKLEVRSYTWMNNMMATWENVSYKMNTTFRLYKIIIHAVLVFAVNLTHIFVDIFKTS